MIGIWPAAKERGESQNESAVPMDQTTETESQSENITIGYKLSLILETSIWNNIWAAVGKRQTWRVDQKKKASIPLTVKVKFADGPTGPYLIVNWHINSQGPYEQNELTCLLLILSWVLLVYTFSL